MEEEADYGLGKERGPRHVSGGVAGEGGEQKKQKIQADFTIMLDSKYFKERVH